MAARYNFPVHINEMAPDFELPDLDGARHRLSEYRGRLVIVNFWSCECPHSERADHALMAMFVQWRANVMMLSIGSNRNEAIESMAAAARDRHLPLLLVDADGRVADLYEAQTTPHLFVIDRAGLLRYRGALDDVTFRQRKPTRFYLDEAVEALLESRSPAVAETPAYGCTVVREV
jgi:peroxiredoxin